MHDGWSIFTKDIIIAVTFLIVNRLSSQNNWKFVKNKANGYLLKVNDYLIH